MARANLNVVAEVKESFTLAQEERNVRLFKITIHQESLVLNRTVNNEGSATEDFSIITTESILTNSEAAFVLYCLDDLTNETKTEALPWLLITWIPDGCRVRDKMLYSSSIKDLKTTLGAGFFKNEYAANVIADLTWAQYQTTINRVIEVNENIMTEKELLLLEEKLVTQAESNSAGSSASAMGVMPFNMSPEVISAFEAFQSSSEYTWLEVEILLETGTVETVSLVQAIELKQFSSFQSLVDTENPRFIIARLPKGTPPTVFDIKSTTTVFVYSCPESTPVRMKMTMASSKASVMAAAQSKGLTFQKTLEIRDPADIDALLLEEMNGATAGGCEQVSSAAAQQLHSKPSRPGRGARRQVAKFSAA